MKTRRPLDRMFLITAGVLILVGFLIFSSASLGLLAKNGNSYSSIVFNQLVLGLGLGGFLLFITSQIPYTFWRKYSLYIFIAALFVTLLVFVPALGLHAGGAKRWIIIAGFSFQPAEFLKIGIVLYFAAWLSAVRTKLHLYQFGLIPLIVFLGLSGGIMLAQPDTGTFLVIISAIMGMYVAAGARLRDLGILFVIFILAGGSLMLIRPYIMERVTTFLDPASDPLGSGYQINQSLIAIGSGGWFGRGYGQSIQKFNYLPEPVGDSIFSVAAEEFGFLGSILLILGFLFFAFRGFAIAIRAPDHYSGLVVTGIVILIVSQSFINIASMLGLMPLTGVPLLFVSHGGTALLFALAEVGIVLNISRYAKPVPATSRFSRAMRRITKR